MKERKGVREWLLAYLPEATEVAIQAYEEVAEFNLPGLEHRVICFPNWNPPEIRVQKSDLLAWNTRYGRRPFPAWKAE